MRLVCHTDEVYSILLLLVQKILQEYRVAINNLNLYQNFQKKKIQKDKTSNACCCKLFIEYISSAALEAKKNT